jgi:cell division protein FtsB
MEDSESLEKFAREQYLMKRDDEEIFIFSEK